MGQATPPVVHMWPEPTVAIGQIGSRFYWLIVGSRGGLVGSSGGLYETEDAARLAGQAFLNKRTSH